MSRQTASCDLPKELPILNCKLGVGLVVSTFKWLDFSASDRQRTMQVLDFFREKSTLESVPSAWHLLCHWKLTAGCLLLLACRSVGRNSSMVKMIVAESHRPMQESQPAERLDNSRCTLHVSSLR